MSSAVKLEGAHRVFSKRFALRNVNLDIQTNEAVAVVGHNGAGKTTLLRLLSTLLPLTQGTATWFGGRFFTDLEEIRKHIGILFVSQFLYDDLSVLENLEFFARLYALADPKKETAFWVNRLALQDLQHAPVRTLSRGERQRVGLARSLLHHPKLLLWDEPTAGLDQAGRAIVNELALEQKERCALVCATHDPDHLRTWVDRTVTLKEGRLV